MRRRAVCRPSATTGAPSPTRHPLGAVCRRGRDRCGEQRQAACRLGRRDRRAHFYCAVVHLTTPDDPAPSIATARWEGVIVDEPRGDNGFGYDAHFLIPALGKTVAELAVDDKNALSHRGQASRRLTALLGAAR